MSTKKKASRDAWLMTPKGRYYQHKCNAARRGVEFKLTFEEWLNIWSDKYDQRGTSINSYVMCRKEDKGAYEVGNVYINTVSHNVTVRPPEPYRSNCKITKEIADQIREMLKEGAMVKTCAALFGISRQSVTDIRMNRTWR